ncbi:MAG: hypothetical protein KOO69_08455, partial [Victivallales bacterium]|nr:hypothetical protein [Victivallales bacterium]
KVQSRLNYLEAKLKRRSGEIGKLSKEKLLRRLEKESLRRLKVMTEMSEAKIALQYEQSRNKELSDSMSTLRQDVMRRDDELTEKKTLLDEHTQRLKKVSDKLQQTKSVLGSVKGSLKETKSKLDTTKGQAKATLMDLTYARGRLSATEKELAEKRSSLRIIQRDTAVNELELKEAKKKIISLQNILKNAVGDLSKTQSELNLSKKQAKNVAEQLMKISTKERATQIALRSIKESLGDAVQGLQNDALEKYSQAAVLLEMDIEERRFLVNYEKTGAFYLPKVMISGKSYLVSSLDLLSGMREIITKSSRINKLNYTVAKPKGGKSRVRVKTPLLSLTRDNRVCILEVPTVKDEYVELLTYDNLRRRGLQNLILFKYKTFGEDSSSLDGRCSLGLKRGDNYLYIRNSVRKNEPELKVEIGDFIMTKQGMFVGVAIEIENFSAGRQQRVKCFVFSDDFDVKDVVKIPLIKASGEQYYTAFAGAVAKINYQLKNLYRMKRLK